MTKQPSNSLQDSLVKRYGSRLYNQLYDLGADLNYVWFLDKWLQMTDALTAGATKYLREVKKARRLKSYGSSSSSPIGGTASEYVEHVMACLDSYIAGYVGGAREHDPSDPLLDPNHPQFNTRRKQVSKRGLELIEASLREEREKKIKEKYPIAEVWMEYAPWPGKYKKGGTQDLRGSFFLLAVTEHLAKHRGRYLLAARLLKTIRGTKGEESKPLKSLPERTRKRVERLKAAHRGWEAHLELLRSHYLAPTPS